VKIIFDENIPFPLKQFFPTDEITTVQLQGWSGFKNGELVSLIDGRFEVFLIADKNLRYQQNLSQRQIAIVELPTNRWPILKIIAGRIVSAVHAAAPGSYTIVPE
jgi:hypothetical protein